MTFVVQALTASKAKMTAIATTLTSPYPESEALKTAWTGVRFTFLSLFLQPLDSRLFVLSVPCQV